MTTLLIYPSFCLGGVRQLIVSGGSYRCMNIHIILYSTYHQKSPSSIHPTAASCCYVVKFITVCPNHIMISLLSSDLLRIAIILHLKSLVTTSENHVRDSQQLLRKIGEETDEGAPNIFFQRSSIGPIILFIFWLAKRSVHNFVSTKYSHARAV
jgi:hypothetical protein